MAQPAAKYVGKIVREIIADIPASLLEDASINTLFTGLTLATTSPAALQWSAAPQSALHVIHFHH